MARVIIVGGGPGGACLGYIMAQAGLDVVLMERQSDFSREFRGEQIMDAGINALKTMGIWDKMGSIQTLRLSSAELFVDRKLALSMRDDSSKQGAIYLPQPPFLQLVLDEAAKFPNFTFHARTTAMNMIEENGRTVGVDCKGPDGERFEVRGDLVVGAEGRFSQTRTKAGLDSDVPKNSENFDVIWCRLPAPPELVETSTSQMYIGDRTFSFALVTPDGDASIGWMIDKGNFTTYKKVGENEWFEQLVKLVPDRMAAHMRAHRSEIKHTLLNVICFNLAKWWKPGLMLIGDAAHPMSPAAGQGITMAFRDAIALTNSLAPLLLKGAKHAEIDAACAAFQKERSKEIDLVQGIQRKMSGVMMQSSAPARFMIRNVIPVLGRWFPDLIAKATAGPKALRYGTKEILLDRSISGNAQSFRKAA
jgi:2-polyprenyl-6-methoxyphenol hydroxylase-like FAD-dependent oxidoreductase